MELSGLDRQLVSPIPRPEEMDTNSCEDAESDEKKVRPPPEHAVKCPRCDSGNTKFCYYNNYSLSQPRYFCKACRRYWTKGGTLRNVPVGGGCRKNKRSAKRAMDSQHRHLIVQSQVENVLSAASSDQYQSKLPLSNFSSPLSYDDSGTGDGLSLAFARLQKQCSGHLGFEFDLHNSISGHHQQAPVFGNPVGGSISLLDQQRSGPNLGFLSNFFEPQTTSFNSQNLYNFNGFEDGGAQNHQSHTQPLLPGEDLSLSNVPAAATEGFTLTSAGSVKQEMCSSDLNDSRILWGFPWQMSNNGEHENNNLVLGSNYSYNNVGNGYEVGGGRESWNNTGLAAAPTWPNLINSALM